MASKMSLNEMGAPATVQRLVFRAARASTPDDWRRLNNIAQAVLVQLPREELDTDVGLLVNAIAACTERIVDLQGG